MNVTTTTPSSAPVALSEETLAALVLGGDMSRLSPTEKVEYYRALCARVGLDPATQPFQLMRLNGKEVLYCGRGGTAQLNKKHEVSHKITDRQMVSDIWIVTAQASTPSGRCTESIGAVPVAGLKGEALANAMMKAETKGKRRATLDLLGLGMSDETEVPSIPGATTIPAPVAVAPVKLSPAPSLPPVDAKPWDALLGANMADAVAWCISRAWIKEGESLDALSAFNAARIRNKPDVFLAVVAEEAEIRRRNSLAVEDSTLTAAQKAVRDVLGGAA